ncbi:Hydrophobin-1 [Acrodontium crateriforme]|uniref:Hydrophobin-1 n=1 Tax=Acrodontium crateriforme TaxID=150365 RepID=A0AAQ3LX68_9PEZI|nr:Hydrophobin-1 [Acrodontium crateriforme]
MFSKTIIALAFAATAVMAAPGFSSGNAEGDQVTACGNGQKLACCSTNGDGNQSLISGLNCLSVPILAVPIEKACGSNVAACCPHDPASGALVIQADCNAIPI